MDLKDQLQQLETAIEEQIARGDALAEKGKEETEELKRQLEVLEKQLKKNKQFLEVILLKSDYLNFRDATFQLIS